MSKGDIKLPTAQIRLADRRFFPKTTPIAPCRASPLRDYWTSQPALFSPPVDRRRNASVCEISS
jgi:hypothetical protein